MSAEKTHPIDLELRAASGPTAVSFRLLPPGPLAIGRRSTNALQLNDPAVSRDHARLSFRPARGVVDSSDGEWLLTDRGSTQGTFLNGSPLKANRQYHLRVGDLMVIGPWTLLMVDRSGASRPATTLATLSDAAMIGTVVSRLETAGEADLPQHLLRLLQECSERIYKAQTEAAVVEAVLDAAITGAYFTRVAFLRPLIDENGVEVVASRGDDPTETSAPRFSRVLIREAACGDPARLQRAPSADAGAPHDVPQGDVIALCVPIMLGAALAGSIYLDRPSNDPPLDATAFNAGVFPVALARLAAMGLANLMRVDIERRAERIESELRAVAETRRLLLPERQGQAGPFTFIGETRQGQDVGGGFFDVIDQGDERLAVVLGDVAGSGIPVSVLVSASQGFLHACLQEQAEPARAVTAVNRFYHSRISDPRFLKLWVGVIDVPKQSLTYVNAGPGWAMTLSPDGRCELLPTGKSLPVGMGPDVEYRSQTVGMAPGGRILILSDGFVEQRARDREDDRTEGSDSPGARDQPQRFGIIRVKECLQRLRPDEDEIAALFSALERHVGATALEQGATAVLIRW